MTALERRSDAEALSYQGQAWSGNRLRESAFAIANVLAAEGVRPGSGVLALVSNTPEVVAARLACSLLGARWIGLPVFFPVSTLVEFARVATASHLIFDPRLSSYAEQVCRIDAAPRALSLGAASTGTDLLSAAASAPVTPVGDRSRDGDIAAVRFTSGSTGVPKGVSWSFAALNVLCDHLGAVLGAGNDMRHMVFHPLGDIGLELVNATVAAEGVVILVEDTDSPARNLALLESERATCFFQPPARIRQMATDPAAALTDLSALRHTLYAGAPLPPEHIRQAMEVFGDTLTQLYGQSEALGVSVLWPSDHRSAIDGGLDRLASAGRPLPGVEVRIAAEDGRRCDEGEIGEIMVRSGSLADGYWRDGALDDSAITDGWLRTGDLGYLTAEGYLYIVGRMRDVIIRLGLKIYAKDVEDALAAHPAVGDVAVLGVPDDQTGEAVYAAVVKAEGAQCDPDELRAFVADRLGRMQEPAHVEVVAEIPTVGDLRKPDKNALARRFAERAQVTGAAQ